MQKAIIIFICFISVATASEFTDFSFGAGLIDQFENRMQTSESGDTNKLDTRLFFESELTYSFNENWKMHPTIGLLMPGGTEDEFIHKFSYFINLVGSYTPVDNLYLRLGSGIYITHISGDGGTTELPNGIQVGQEFPIPEGTAIARNIIATMGIQYFIYVDWSLKLESFLFNSFDDEKRALSHIFSIKYHLQDSLW